MVKYKLFFLLFLILPLSISAQNDYLQLKDIHGFVQIQKLGQNNWETAKKTDRLFAGDKIRTFLESSVVLIYPDKTELGLGENSFLEIKDVSRNPKTKVTNRKLKLNVGTLHYKITPLKEKASEFKIYSHTSIVGVTGTEGIIKAEGEGKPTKNILIEGITFNTNQEGEEGIVQRPGEVYLLGKDKKDLFVSDVEKEARRVMGGDKELSDSLNELITAYEGKRKEGYLVLGLEKIINNALSLLEKKEYALARKEIGRGFVYLEKLRKSKTVEKYAEIIDKLREEIEKKQKDNFNVEEVYLLLERVENALQRRNIRQVNNLLTLLRQRLTSLPKGESDFLKKYNKIETLVIEREEKGFSVDEIKELLRASYLFYENKDYPKAYRFLKEAEDEINLTFKELPAYLEEKIGRIKAVIKEKEKEGYRVANLKLKLERVEKLLKAESYLKTKRLIKQLEEDLLLVKKKLPLDWERKVTELKKEIEEKKSLGFDLASIYDYLIKLEEYKDKGDVKNLAKTYKKIKDSLEKLDLPAGFKGEWRKFLKDFADKDSLGFELKEVRELKERVEISIGRKDLVTARSFLKKAKEKLKEVKDDIPPVVQVLNFQENDTMVKIEGLVNDNIKVKNLYINNSLVDFSPSGEFEYQTTKSSLLDKIVIVAEDVSENKSPPVALAVHPRSQEVKGKLKDVRIDYLENSLLVKGSFIPGGKITVEETDGFCDSEGNFKIKISPEKDLWKEKKVVVKGWNLDGTPANEIVLKVEDKWKPELEVTGVQFDDNLAPTVKVNPLVYKEDRVVVSGKAEDKLMVTITGRVSDIGEGVSRLKIFNRQIEFDNQGNFTTSFSLASRDVFVPFLLEDKAGNIEEIKFPLDIPLSLPVVKVSSQPVILNSKGEFLKEIPLSKELKEVVVEAEDSTGNKASPQVFPLAKVGPPSLEIASLLYDKDKVIISGHTEPGATIYDKSKNLFTKSFPASEDGLFTIQVKRPAEAVEAVLVAYNLAGKTSEEVKIKVEPLVDKKPPYLYLFQPDFKRGKVIVQGFVEDDTQIKNLRIQGKEVEISPEGKFYQEIPLEKDLKVIEVVAEDSAGKIKKKLLAINDKNPPRLAIDSWEIKEGKLFISGVAKDDIGVKEIRLNNIPVKRTQSKEVRFDYQGVITQDLKEVTITAIDFYGNVTKYGPRKLEIYPDKVPPELNLSELEYGSPIVFVSGKVTDQGGINTVYVNGEKVKVFNDGSFKAKVEIDVGEPRLTLEKPSYKDGKVMIKGRVEEGDFDPSEIVVEAEDLWGNRSQLFTREVKPFKRQEINVFVEGELVDVDSEGNFSKELILEGGKKRIEVEAQDPFNNSTSTSVELENTPPLLKVNDLEYIKDEKAVVISGKAEDTESGLKSILINGIKVDFDSQGNFSYKFSLEENVLVVVASDYVGNTVSLTKEVTPPDVWPPVFYIEVRPLSAILGKPVHVEISSLDSKTMFPDILAQPPTVVARVGGREIPLKVEGEGSRFVGILDTEGLAPGVGEVVVQGKDKAGNFSSKIKGINKFTLIAEDRLPPTFSLEYTPSPLILGEDARIKVFSSEDLKSLPQLEVELTNGENKKLELEKTGEREFRATLKVPLDIPLGEVTFRLKGGQDLSGNTHNITESKAKLTAPSRKKEIPLKVDFVEFIPEKFTLKGITVPSALVHIEFFTFSQDIVADEEGKFVYEKYIDLDTLKGMHKISPSLLVKLKARNYAGLESSLKTFEVTLPALPSEEKLDFRVVVNPLRVEQGQELNFMVEPLKKIEEFPRGIIYLPGGKVVPVSLEGRDRLFKGRYIIPEDTPAGKGMLEVVSGSLRAGTYFDVVVASRWLKEFDKERFYSIRAIPDPMVKGKEARFVVTTLGDLEEPPQLVLILPNNRREEVELRGSKREFLGTYICPQDIPSGRAEIILNPGKPEEIRRPFGVEEEIKEGVFRESFLTTNPTPLVSGSPFEVKVVFSQNVNFLPVLLLKLSDGATVTIDLQGSLPANTFTAKAILPPDVSTGLAKFILMDNKGGMINTFPALIVPSFGGRRGIELFVFPESLKRLETATVQLNSLRPLKFSPTVSITFSDGRKIVLPLEGEKRRFKGSFLIPEDASSGMVSIEAVDNQGKILARARAGIVEERGGKTRIFVEPEDFEPGEKVEVTVETDASLFFLPKASLVWEGGSQDISLKGNIPGNRFAGVFTAPEQEIGEATLEVRDDKGGLLGDYRIRRAPRGGGQIVLQPMPPILGKPLAIKVVAPQIIDFHPTLRLIFAQGVKELKLYGVLPGDTFTATLERLESPLKFIEILDKEGKVVVKLPVEFLEERVPLGFDIEPTSEMVPGEIVSLVVRANTEVPFVPRLRLDFAGKVVDVPLSGLPFSREFFGKFVLPSDVSGDRVKASIFDPEGRIIWQKVFFGRNREEKVLSLNVTPQGEDGFDLSWDRLGGVSFYELRYGEDESLKEKVVIEGDTFYSLRGLEKDRTYYFQVVALDSGRREVVRSAVISAVSGKTKRELFLQDIINEDEIQLFWEDYPGADSYRVSWGNVSGNYPNSTETRERSFTLQGLVSGKVYFIKVFALKEGEVIGESREVMDYLEKFIPQLEIRVNPDPPRRGEDLEIYLHFFQDITFTPRVILNFSDGSKESLDAQGEKRDFRVLFPGEKFKNALTVINVEDEDANHLGDLYFGEGREGLERSAIRVEPYPPLAGEALNINVEIPVIVPVAPRLRLRYTDGTSQELELEGDLPGRRFFAHLDTLEKPLIAIDLLDPLGIVRDTLNFAVNTQKELNIIISPDPPRPGEDLSIKLEFSEQVSFKPKLFLEFADGRRKEFFLPQEPPVSIFEMVIPASEMSSPLIRVVVEDQRGGFLGDRVFEEGLPVGVEIINYPDPPLIGNDLNIKVEFPQAVPFIPRLFLEFVDGARKEFTFSQSPGSSVFEISIPGSEITQPVNRIVIEDDRGGFLGDKLFGEAFPQGGLVYLSVAGTGSLNVSWDEVPGADNYQIWYGTSSGNYNESGSPVNVGRVTSYTLTGLIDGTTYYVIVEAFDTNGNLIYTTPESFITLSASTIPYPTNIWVENSMNPGELIVNWNYVSGVAGYKVYYGRSSRVYNEPGSPIQIDDPSITRAVISGLIDGVPYYITVTCFTEDGQESSYSPREIEAFPGAFSEGSGSIRIVTSSGFPEIEFQQVTLGQDTETKYVTIENKSSSSANIKVKVKDLINTLDLTTTISSSNIHIPTSFTVSGSSSVSQPIYISVPATGVNPGDYAGDIIFYDDVNDNDIQEEGESFAVLHLWMLFGGEGLEILEEGGDLGRYTPGSTTPWLPFHLKNTSANNYDSIQVIAPTMVKFPDLQTQLASSNVEVNLATTLGAGQTVEGSVRVNIPSNTLLGEYGGMLAIYNDTNHNGSLDSDEPLETFPIHFFVVDVAGEGANLRVSEDILDFGSVYPGDSYPLNIYVRNDTSYPYDVVRIVKEDLVTSGNEVLDRNNIIVGTPFNISPFSEVSKTVTVNVPPSQPSGTYQGNLRFYADLDNDGAFDNDEPYDDIVLRVTINRIPITSLSAQDRGIGGTVDLYWDDPNFDTDHYNIYYVVHGNTFDFTNPQATSTQKAIQISGLTDGVAYDFIVRSVGPDGDTDNGTTAVSATPTTSGVDSTPPTFAGIKRAYATGNSGEVVLEWEEASDQNPPITYEIAYGTSPSNLTQGIPDITATTYTITGLQDGQVYYFRVRAKDNAGNIELNNHLESAIPAGGVSKIVISGSTSSTVGKPVLVKLEAQDSGGQLVNTFNDSVNIQVSDSSPRIKNSYLLSIQDRMTGELAEVEMSGGVGYFTVDTLEPEVITLQTVGVPSNTFQIEFLPPQGSLSVDSFAIQGPDSAIVDTGTGEGALVWVSVIDSYGKVVTDYTGTIDIIITEGIPNSTASLALEDGNGTLNGTQYTFAPSDAGEVLFRLKDTESENITMSVSSGNIGSNTYNVEFLGVDKFFIASGATFALNYDTIGRRMRFTAYAGNATTGKKLGGYNGTASWVRLSEEINNDSSWVSPSTIQFKDGVAQFYVEDSEYEDVQFQIVANGIQSDPITVSFHSTDTTPPDVLEVVAETPYLIHIYFDEEIDSTNALREDNYDVGVTINKVCWYEDNVTLHLASPLPLGTTQTLTIKGQSSNGTNAIKDKDGNYIPGDIVKSFVVPSVDYQGQANPSGDWFEIQLTRNTVPAGVDTEVGVTVFHKNACGYLTGSNRVNARTLVSSATVTYSGTGTVVNGPTDIDISTGKATFTIVVNCASGENVQISITSGNVSTLSPPEIVGQ